jgi:hypothetical protein
MVRASSEEIDACALIGTVPQFPLPPLMILLANVSITASEEVYFFAISIKAGPTSFSCSLWQVLQSDFEISCAPAAEGVPPAFSVPLWLAAVSWAASELVATAVLLAADVLSAVEPLPDLLLPQAAITRLKPQMMNVFFMSDRLYYVCLIN